MDKLPDKLDKSRFARREHLSIEEAIRAIGRLTALGADWHIRVWSARNNPYYVNGTVFTDLGVSEDYLSYDEVRTIAEAMIEEGFVPTFSPRGDEDGHIRIRSNVSLASHEPQYGINDKK